MDKEEIYLGDWKRLLIGEDPWIFTAEIFVRTFIVYVCLIIVLRLLGKRMNAQLTNMDLAVMLTLGAIASVPMQAFDRGLIPGILLLVAVLGIHRGVTYMIYSRRKVEVVIEGQVSCVVKDGRVDAERLEKLRISKKQLFALLRDEGVRHLGQVKRYYSEADGTFSCFRFEETRPGLCVFPDYSKDVPHGHSHVENFKACTYCGNIKEKKNTYPAPCDHCGNQEWVSAIQ